MSNFAVQVYRDKYNWNLKVTHNGWQWTVITIRNPEVEIPKIIEELKDGLKQIKEEATINDERNQHD